MAELDTMWPTVTPMRYVDIFGVIPNWCRVVPGSSPGRELSSAMVERAIKFSGACMEMEKVALKLGKSKQGSIARARYGSRLAAIKTCICRHTCHVTQPCQLHIYKLVYPAAATLDVITCENAAAARSADVVKMETYKLNGPS